MLLVGGFGLAFPAMITLAMSAASDSDAGVTSGLVNTTQQAGAALPEAAQRPPRRTYRRHSCQTSPSRIASTSLGVPERLR
jgi:hypothetical protein